MQPTDTPATFPTHPTTPANPVETSELIVNVHEQCDELLQRLDRHYGTVTRAEHSALDRSVNFIIRSAGVGMIEARYVQRDDDEVIIYLSSQSGCRQACRFCHLTQSGQTALENEELAGYRHQTELVLGYYRLLTERGMSRARVVNFNFMSRGELLANPMVLEHGDALLRLLGSLAREAGLYPRFKCSTIMPMEMHNRELVDVFCESLPDIYYSLYSVDIAWRKRWMPKAMDPFEALGKLARWQTLTRKIPVIHWALIHDPGATVADNCSQASTDAVISAVLESGLRPDFNLVRYNPANSRLGREPDADIIEQVALSLAQGLPGSRVQVVGRVGHDIKASCGTFITGSDATRPQGIQQLPVLPSSASRFVR